MVKKCIDGFTYLDDSNVDRKSLQLSAVGIPTHCGFSHIHQTSSVREHEMTFAEKAQTHLARSTFPILPFIPGHKSSIFGVAMIQVANLLDSRPQARQCQPLQKCREVVIPLSGRSAIGRDGLSSSSSSGEKVTGCRKDWAYVSCLGGTRLSQSLQNALHRGLKHIHPCSYTCGVGLPQLRQVCV